MGAIELLADDGAEAALIIHALNGAAVDRGPVERGLLGVQDLALKRTKTLGKIHHVVVRHSYLSKILSVRTSL